MMLFIFSLSIIIGCFWAVRMWYDRDPALVIRTRAVVSSHLTNSSSVSSRSTCFIPSQVLVPCNRTIRSRPSEIAISLAPLTASSFGGKSIADMDAELKERLTREQDEEAGRVSSDETAPPGTDTTDPIAIAEALAEQEIDGEVDE